MVAARQAYCKRTLGLCLEQRVGLITLVPRTCTVRQEVEAWGQQHGGALWLKHRCGPGRSRGDAGMGKVSSAVCQRRTLPDAAR
jgi:hypothetical protein